MRPTTKRNCKSPSKKEQYTVFVLTGWAFSQITLGLYLFLFKDSKGDNLAYSLNNSISVFYFILFVLCLILTIAVFLFLEQIQETVSEEEQQLNIAEQGEEQKNTRPWYQTLLPYSYKPFIGGCILMFVMQMFYYRTQFTLDQFGLSLPLNTIVVGCMELMANLIFTKVVDKAPRKLLIRCLLILLMILFMMLVAFKDKVVQTVVQGIMRLFDASIMIVLGVYLPELFHPDERGKGTNYIMSFGVLGSALNSIILNNFRFWQMIFFLVAAFCSTFLFKETYSSNRKKSKDPREGK